MELTSSPLGAVFRTAGRSGWGALGSVVSIHIDHLRGEERLPVTQSEEQLLVVVAGVGRRLDIDEAELAGVGALVQVGHGHGVGVVPARAGRAQA